MCYIKRNQLRNSIKNQLYHNFFCIFYNAVEAMTAVDAYLLSVEHFHYLCDHDHVFCRLLLTEVSRRTANSTVRTSLYALYPIRYAFEKLFIPSTSV
ncbi:hypothetical protein BACFRA24663_08785 [Bacteroides fragilis]